MWLRTIMIGLCLAVLSHPSARAAPVTIGGPFALSGPGGKTVTDRSFAGRWLLVYFGYTACPDSCPTALADIAQTLAKLGANAERVQAIFITLDPSRDTHEIIDEYVKSFDLRIMALTGRQDQIDAVAHAYGAYVHPHYEESDHAGPATAGQRLDHSVYIYLMDPNGGFVRAFDPNWSSERMADALRRAFTSGRDGGKRS